MAVVACSQFDGFFAGAGESTVVRSLARKLKTFGILFRYAKPLSHLGPLGRKEKQVALSRDLS